MSTELTTMDERELISPEDIASTALIEGIKNPDTTFFCSIENTGDRKTSALIYNAINSKGTPLQDMVGKKIEVVDVACHPVELVNKDTGEISKTLRTVLIDKKGDTYSCVSSGVVSSLQKIFAIIGMPSWKDDPVILVPALEKTNNGFRVMTLSMSV